jgi:hypothetical protein
MNNKLPLCYRFGYNYELGTFNPIQYYNCFISFRDEAPYLNEASLAQICAGSPVHSFGTRAQLLEVFPNSEADYSIVDWYKSLYEGIAKALFHFNPEYRREEEKQISILESVLGTKITPIDDSDRDRISSELIALVEELDKEKRFPPSSVCRQIAGVLVNCQDPTNNAPRFNEAIGVIKNSIPKLSNFSNPIDLHWKIHQEVLNSKLPNVFVFEAAEIHASVWNAFELFHLCLEASIVAGSSMPMTKSLSSLLNSILPGFILPFVLVFPREKYDIGIYAGETEMRTVRDQVSKDYCILCTYLQKLIDNIFQVDYRDLAKIGEIYSCLWEFIINAEKLWQTGARKCPDCGRVIRPFSDGGRMQTYLLENSALCQNIFKEATESYLEWFKNVAATEATSLLK